MGVMNSIQQKHIARDIIINLKKMDSHINLSLI